MIWSESNEHIHALVYQLPKEGKSVCGDSFYFNATDQGMLCALADGLGSGELAYESSSAISEVVKEHGDEDVASLMERCNQALKQKRGATVSILKADFQTRTIAYSSVGNIRFILYAPSDKYIYPLPVTGYMSGKPQTYKTFTYTYEKGSKFIIHSDGLDVPALRTYLKQHHSPGDISNQLEAYTLMGKDDLTYIIGQLF
ncbi:PP2C family serine/threonine-protein phosphatase [Bacillus swezeyi]|uniref:Phosphoserine phosphatase n=1 Tax=Bacillus swezeyi TaxID=1925020 RepID=A0A5M8RM14_9BACI|nr:PP2C family serine/threonine-protein phosphatase [Bacillus swezeyi]KAA6449647.1 phosphoserine phosphatase [Bacillus swezeyi]KAA6474420.1 phosphoserine phosphatase [Bacillus swezeyi]TYS33664.1 SpoIIE family protein phosphatase [Bacillus swezeyi]